MKPFLIVAYFSSASVLIPLVLAILQWRRLPVDIAPFRWLLVACAITELASFGSSQVFSIPNLYLGDIYMFLQFSLLLYIFSLQFERKAVFRVLYAALVVFYVINLLLFKNLSISTAVSSLVLIIVSIIFFYKLLNELKVSDIHRLPILWISFAALFYYSGTLFIFLSRNYLEGVPDSYIMIWIAHNIINIIKNLLFAFALWQNYRTMRSSV